jgi:RHS repeat-associated protein
VRARLKQIPVRQEGEKENLKFSGVWEEYRYDPLRRHIMVRTRTDGGLCDVDPWTCTGSITRYVWAGDQILWELKASGNAGAALEATTASGAAYGEASYTHAGGIDRPLVITKNGTSLVPHQNWRRMFALATRTDGYQSAADIDWPGFHTTPWRGATRVVENWWGSLSTEMRDATGQIYKRNRYYDPASGQFTQPDPIGLAGGLNSYGFAAGDPVSYSNPYGLCPPLPDCFNPNPVRAFRVNSACGGTLGIVFAFLPRARWLAQQPRTSASLVTHGLPTGLTSTARTSSYSRVVPKRISRRVLARMHDGGRKLPETCLRSKRQPSISTRASTRRVFAGLGCQSLLTVTCRRVRLQFGRASLPSVRRHGTRRRPIPKRIPPEGQMNRTTPRGTSHRKAALVLGAAAVLVAGIITAALWLGSYAGEIWGGILTETAKSTSPQAQRLPSGSVVLLEGRIVGQLESVRSYRTAEGVASALSLYTGRWTAEDAFPLADDSTYSAELVSPSTPGVPIVLHLVLHPRNRLRKGELRLMPLKRTIPVY